MTDKAPYRLSIARDAEPFRKEIEYACRFIEQVYGLVQSAEAQTVLHYGDNPPPHAIVVPAVLFPHGVSADERGIHLERTAADKLFERTAAPYLFPPKGGIGHKQPGEPFEYDALGLLFVLLSRIEERQPQDVDAHGRFTYRSSFYARYMGGIDTPWADLAARDLAAALKGESKPDSKTRFAVTLTHDVDRLKGYHKVHLPLRYALGELARSANAAKALTHITNGYLSGEPWRSMNAIMDLSDRHGVQSRFFLMGPSTHPKDSTYALSMAGLLKKVAAHIRRRGHLLGFHPGYDTSTDRQLWLSQKEALEDIIEHPVQEGRQHVLRYDIAQTPSIWSAAGMQVDYSMAFADMPGFRTGTCRAYDAYDLVARRTLAVRFLATPITEFGLIGGKYQDLSVDQALQKCDPIIDACREFDGDLCVLYHSSNPDRQQGLFYKALIQELL